MATIYNRATLSYGGVLTNSNVAESEIREVISATKTALSVNYGSFDGVAYAISIVNTGDADMTDVRIEDDLGAFAVGTTVLTPLKYIDGSVRYFQNGILSAPPEASAGPPLVISGITVPGGGSVVVTYEAEITAVAPLESGSEITNNATVTGNGICDSAVSATVPVRDETKLSISKSVCPGEITCGGEITYTFVIQNTGNTEAVATDNVILTDVFDPILSITSVTYNGVEITEGTGYTYDAGTGTFATTVGQITVPAATYTRDGVTGVVTVTPGVTVITVTGTV